jgi:predicted SAM-dependent methyltransferase
MEHEWSLAEHFMFELKSVLGRRFFNGRPRLYDSGANVLNLGCGPNNVPGYVNADFYSFRKIIGRNASRLEWYLDLRYPLQCRSDTFDGVFSEHTIEHLYPAEVAALLKELYRCMKNGAVIRLTVPDVGMYVKFYRGELGGEVGEGFRRRFATGCQAIRNMAQNYFHRSVWDFDELSGSLAAAGFRNISRMEFGVGAMSGLLLDRKDRAWETMYVEAVK